MVKWLFYKLIKMDSIIIQNGRGLNDFNKQREVKRFCRENKVRICGIIEIKIKG